MWVAELDVVFQKQLMALGKHERVPTTVSLCLDRMCKRLVQHQPSFWIHEVCCTVSDCSQGEGMLLTTYMCLSTQGLAMTFIAAMACVGSKIMPSGVMRVSFICTADVSRRCQVHHSDLSCVFGLGQHKRVGWLLWKPVTEGETLLQQATAIPKLQPSNGLHVQPESYAPCR